MSVLLSGSLLETWLEPSSVVLLDFSLEPLWDSLWDSSLVPLLAPL